MGEINIGITDWFDDTKGFGVIKQANNQEVFFHISNWIDEKEYVSSYRNILFYDLARYELKITAKNCRYFNYNSEKDWNFLFSLSNYERKIIINDRSIDIIAFAFSWVDCVTDYGVFEHHLQKLFFKTKKIDFENSNSIIHIICSKTKNEQFRNYFIELLNRKFEQFDANFILNFWRKTIIEGYTPTNDFLHKNFKKLTFEEVQSISNKETLNLIVLKKLGNLKQKLSFKQFILFDKYLKLISNEDLKTHILNTLSLLSESIIKEEFKSIDKIEDQNLKLNTAIEFHNNLPLFLNEFECGIQNIENNIISILEWILINASDEKLINQTFDYLNVLNKIENHNFKNKVNIFFRNHIEQRSPDLVVNFWNKNIIKSFIPSEYFLIENINLLNINLIEKIKDKDILAKVVVEKINILKSEFNKSDFTTIDDYLLLIDDTDLKKSILNTVELTILNKYLDEIINIFTDILLQDRNNESVFELYEEIPNFIKTYFKSQLNTSLHSAFVANAGLDLIIEAISKNIINNISQEELVIREANNLDDFKYAITKLRLIESEQNFVLDKLLSYNQYYLILNYANQKAANLFDEYDKKIFIKSSANEYISLWENKLGKILPTEKLDEYLGRSEKNFKRSESWVRNEKFPKDILEDIFKKILNEQKPIENRFDFYRKKHAVNCIILLDKIYKEKLKELNDDFIDLLLWNLNYSNKFDFNCLKGKFIYFEPSEQVEIFKKIFYLKNIGAIQFNIEELDEIVRADFDLFLTNEKFENDFILDISTHIIIELIKSFGNNGHFKFESKYILEDIQRNADKRFKIEHYFDKCEGRMEALWDWNTAGDVKKIHPKEGNPYFAISFSTQNMNFETLKENVKKLPDRRWISSNNIWVVPQEHSEAVFEFAMENKFFIKLIDGNHYTNNKHLINLTRKNIPNGISYCEGRKANTTHNSTNKEFWWCLNSECHKNSIFKNSENDEKKHLWETYTLLDFLNILGLEITVEDYSLFLGHINAFNRLLEKLYCEECSNLIYPKDTSNFALFRDTRFYCINDCCSKKRKEIYLTHCSNGKCKSIIDSRVSKRCNHGLYICDKCGTCCSHTSFKRRLKNLEKTGGFIHSNLIYNVENNNGHLEKKEYYCFKCAGMMTQISELKFECDKCDVKYDFEKLNYIISKWTNVENRRKDYPVKK